MVDVLRPEETVTATEHEGVTVYQLVPKWTMMEETEGSYLEFVDEFEVPMGGQVDPHYHDSVEFYRVLEGKGIVQVEDEARYIGPGDLIRIPRNARHSLWTEREPVRVFCFSVSRQEPGGIGWVNADLPRVQPTVPRR